MHRIPADHMASAPQAMYQRSELKVRMNLPTTSSGRRPAKLASVDAAEKLYLD
jgi:hypothetical protein